MSVVKSGITPTLLNYGTVVLETAGADRVAFLISGVPRPESIQLLIDRERDRERAPNRGARQAAPHGGFRAGATRLVAPTG
jgi:hypothetical protein